MDVMGAPVDKNSLAPDKRLYRQVFSLVGVLIFTVAIVVTSLIWQHKSEDNRRILANDYHLAAAEWSAKIEIIAAILLEKVETNFKIQRLLEIRSDNTLLEIEYFTISQVVEDAMYASTLSIKTLQSLEEKYGDDTAILTVTQLSEAKQTIEALMNTPESYAQDNSETLLNQIRVYRLRAEQLHRIYNTGYRQALELSKEEKQNENILLGVIVLVTSLGGLVLVVIILTQIRKNEIQLQAAKTEAVRANKAKSEFLSTMSHELRTPLNAIIGFSDVICHEIMGPVSPSKYQEYAKDINVSGNHLLYLINQVLDMSKIESGKYTVYIEDFELKETIEEVIAMMKGRAISQKISLLTEIPIGPLQVKADQMITKQVLINLLTNAIKFTPDSNSITIRATSGEENIIIDVIDNGIGMSPEELKRAYEPFVQIEREKGRHHEGTGLGLSLCIHFAALQGSELVLKSKQGKGTTATISLPSTGINAIEGGGGSIEEPVEVPQWVPSMSIGTVKWDLDHVELLNIINKLKNSADENEPFEVANNLKKTLAHYVDIHLASEEFVMKQLEYPDYAAHKTKHDEFRGWMKAILNSSLDSKDELHSPELADHLLEWWYDHILKDDMAYKTFFYTRRKDVEDLLVNYKGVGSSHSL